NQSNIPNSLKQQVNLDNVNFVTNEQLDDVLAQTTATPEQVVEAVEITENARLRALRASFLILACLALLAIFPAKGLPDYAPGEGPPEPAPPVAAVMVEEASEPLLPDAAAVDEPA